MRQNVKKAHPRQYNDEMEALATRTKTHGWALADVRLMTAAKRRFIAKGCHNINQLLLEVLPHKTLDAIKDKRRKDSYKSLLSKTNSADTDLLSDESESEGEIVPSPVNNQTASNDNELSYTSVEDAFGDDLDPDS